MARDQGKFGIHRHCSELFERRCPETVKVLRLVLRRDNLLGRDSYVEYSEGRIFRFGSLYGKVDLIEARLELAQIEAQLFLLLSRLEGLCNAGNRVLYRAHKREVRYEIDCDADPGSRLVGIQKHVQAAVGLALIQPLVLDRNADADGIAGRSRHKCGYKRKKMKKIHKTKI